MIPNTKKGQNNDKFMVYEPSSVKFLIIRKNLVFTQVYKVFFEHIVQPVFFKQHSKCPGTLFK